MIPKIIHYCWFGYKEKPKAVQNYINQWKRMLPDYKIIEWNETNFDINYNLYTQQAYKEKKYAFVSDVARLFALYEFGGIYLDTDIEIKKDFNDLLSSYDMILGYENNGTHLMTAFMASSKNNSRIQKFLHSYEDEAFILEDGKLNTYPNTYRITEMLKKEGIIMNGEFQHFEREFALYPEKSFSAMEFRTFTEISDDSTYTVHHFNSSWMPWYIRLRRKIKKVIITKRL